MLSGWRPSCSRRHLIGGLTVAESGLDLGRLREHVAASPPPSTTTSTFVLPPLPNTLFTRDSSCWIYGGVSINPMYWPARRLEAYNVAAIYRYHPMFAEADFEYWYPRARRRRAGSAWRTSAGPRSRAGTSQPIGNGTVLIGISERTQARMIEQIARALFAKGAAERVIAVRDDQGPGAHAPRHGVHDARPRQGDRLPAVVDGIRAISLRPGVQRARSTCTEEKGFLGRRSPTRSGVPKLHVVETGGDAYQQEREQWDDGNNVVALEPGVVVAYERNTYTIAKMREAGVEVVTDRGVRARQGTRRRPLHDLPDRARPDLRRRPWSAGCAGSWRS